MIEAKVSVMISTMARVVKGLCLTEMIDFGLLKLALESEQRADHEVVIQT